MDQTEVRDRQVRAARTQIYFRVLNERITEALRPWEQAFPGEIQEWVCECCLDSCSQPLALTVDEYDRVRADPTRFVVAPEHADPLIEQVVEQSRRFWVVEKIEEGAEIARKTNPR